jgi:hypothetical protein
MRQRIRFCASTDGICLAFADLGSGPHLVGVVQAPQFRLAESRLATLVRYPVRRPSTTCKPW